MSQPKILVLGGMGINCEEETLHCFEQSGARGEIIHANALIEAPEQLDNFQIFVIPGGFSYGDHTGSGFAMAKHLKGPMGDKLFTFLARKNLILGICNGCQILSHLFASHNQKPSYALLPNAKENYIARWVTVKTTGLSSPWLNGIEELTLPVAHGEGQFYCDSLPDHQPIAMQYTHDQVLANGLYPHNPNGSVHDIAAITDESGHCLMMMPHPERAYYNFQTPDWPLKQIRMRESGQKLPEFTATKQLFDNAIAYFQ